MPPSLSPLPPCLHCVNRHAGPFVIMSVCPTAVLLLFLFSLLFAFPVSAQQPSLLVFSKTAGFRHSSIPKGVEMIRSLGEEKGFSVEHTEDAAMFTENGLAPFDAVVFLSTTGNILNGDQQAAFERFVRGGGGFVGIHAAADTEYEWPWYADLVGAYFQSHPQIQQATIVVNDRVHPSTDMLPLRWQRTDEWYNYRENPRGDVHVLLTLDEKTYSGGEDGHDHPIAWCHPFDGGRSWYTGGGHTEASYDEPLFREHVSGGIRWALGLVDGECAATLDSSFEKTILDDDTVDPMELTVLPDGRVVFVERGGAVKIYDPTAGSTSTAGRLPVYTGQEDGLLGVTHDPNFIQNGWIYLFYSPAGTASKQRISRFSLNGASLDRQSEKVILEIPTQRDECCHSGGSLAFGPDGNLYASLGDNTNPFASDGFAPIDERAGREPWDAQRTSGNTQDLRGAIIRITPQPDGTYSIPEGNLFENPADGRPEIYVMGNRNPFRIAVDSETGWLYWGEVGPDSRSDHASRGPKGYDEFNQARAAGNFGWPYCIADNKAYREFDFASGTSGPGFDCVIGPTNNSPNNTGATRLPAGKPAWIWYPYDNSPDFPEVNGGGGRTAMGGPVYHAENYAASSGALPGYYDDTVFIYEWSRNWIKEVKLDENGGVLKINPFLPNLTFARPMEMELGPDGAIYMLEWGTGFGGGNNDSKLIRIRYAAGSHAPVARATATPTSGPLPLTVSFSGSDSYDSDPSDALAFAWDFDDDGTIDSNEPDAAFTYTVPGNYTAKLAVTDSDGLSGTASIPIVAGNSRPTVTIEHPADGGFFEWGDSIPFRIRVDDPEDGEIDCGSVVVQPGIGHNDHNHPLNEIRACEGMFEAAAPGHGDDGANVFHVVTASYTDRGAEGVGSLSASAIAMLRPKRIEAEHFTSERGAKFVEATDPEGGALAAWVQAGDYLSYAPVNLEGIDSIAVRVASYSDDGRIEIRRDAWNGPLLASIDVPATGGPQNWIDVSTAVSDGGGPQELFFVFERDAGGGSLFLVNAMEFIGRGVATSVDRPGSVEPDALVLGHVYPNPFTDETTISYTLAYSAHVRLEVFDTIGRRVASLVDAVQAAGMHTIRYNAASQAAGVYFFRLTTPHGTSVGQMVSFR